ncbi:hypothetical protein AVEN_164287-1 [Araneus ventricosus]|uniref:Uncharacterized protein n=1 Tax=Araneus ventricosus TaxID=182803 RepID=A0A4Y2GYW7_ARAVE|nr:hypothetical protein AVEN_164287-1 [Araneus ventricosus]
MFHNIFDTVPERPVGNTANLYFVLDGGLNTVFGISVKNNCYFIAVMPLDIIPIYGVNITESLLLWSYYTMNKRASIKNEVKVGSVTNWSLWNCIRDIMKHGQHEAAYN